MAWAERQPSGKWKGLYRLPDGRRRSAGTFTTRKAARDAANDAESAVRQIGWRDPRRGLRTWGDWSREWWPARSIESNTSESESSMIFNHIAPAFNDWPLNSITRHDVQAWATSLVTTNYGTEEKPRYLAASSAHRILGTFVSSLSAAVEKELIDSNPATRIRLPPPSKGNEVFLTRQQFAEIRSNVAHPEDRAVLDFLVGTGLRWSELAGLHVHQLNLTTGMVTVREVWDGSEIKPYPKGRRLRHVPVFQWAVDELRIPATSGCGLPHREGACASGLLFPGRRGGVRDDRNFTRRVIEPALAAAGLAHLHVTLHTFRHTYASWLVQSGVSLERVASLLGHSSSAVTQRYAHLAPPSHEELMVALPRPSGANRGQTPITDGYAGLRTVGSN